MSELRIRNVEHAVLLQSRDSDLLNPFPLALPGGGFALVFQKAERLVAPGRWDFAASSAVCIAQADTPEQWADAPADEIPGSHGFGQCPALRHTGEGRFILLDWRWGLFPENEKPAYGFRVPGWDGWAGFGECAVRTAALRDGAWSFGQPSVISLENEKSVRTGPCIAALDDGALLVPAYCADPLNNQFTNHVFVLRSTDAGQTWSQWGTLDRRDKQYAPLTETVAARAGGDSLCALIRTTNKFDFALCSRSSDAGRTWSLPERTDLQGHATDMVALPDGEFLAALALLPDAEGAASREPGIRIAKSADSGAQWPVERMAVLRGDLPQSNLDRPRLLDLGSGRFMAVYHGAGPHGRAVIFGTRFEFD